MESVTTRVFGEAKKPADETLHAYRIVCRDLPELFCCLMLESWFHFGEAQSIATPLDSSQDYSDSPVNLSHSIKPGPTRPSPDVSLLEPS